MEDRGAYHDVEHGIALGCSLSPLMAALYLKPLDDKMHEAGVYYARFMDDWVAIAPTRWRLRDLVDTTRSSLNMLKLEKLTGKTFIGRANRGFDFLGYQLTAERLTVSKVALKRRDQKMLRLYEHGASDTRVEAYRSRWERWADEGLQDRLTPPPKQTIKRLAALSAGLTAIAAVPAHAAIVTGNVGGGPIGPGGFIEIDIDGGGTDFTASNLLSSTNSPGAVVTQGYGNLVRLVYTSSTINNALIIDTMNPFHDNPVAVPLTSGVSTSFIFGFTETSESFDRLGYLCFTFDGTSLFVGEFAYNDIDGGPIHVDAVPIPPAALLFGSALGWLGLSRRKRQLAKP